MVRFVRSLTAELMANGQGEAVIKCHQATSCHMSATRGAHSTDFAEILSWEGSPQNLLR